MVEAASLGRLGAPGRRRARDALKDGPPRERLPGPVGPNARGEAALSEPAGVHPEHQSLIAAPGRTLGVAPGDSTPA